MRSSVCAALAVLVSACATSSVTQIRAPDGTAVLTVKCSADATKCFAAATESCPAPGTYRVLTSASRAGGIAADLMPGPVTWYYMTYVCGPSDGRMPDFAFQGQAYVPPAVIVTQPRPAATTTNCFKAGNTVNCTTY